MSFPSFGPAGHALVVSATVITLTVFRDFGAAMWFSDNGTAASSGGMPGSGPRISWIERLRVRQLLEDRRAKVESLEAMAQEDESRRVLCTSILQHLQMQAAQIDSSLADVAQQRAATEQRITTLKSDYAALDERIKRLRATIGELSKQVQQLTARLAEVPVLENKQLEEQHLLLQQEITHTLRVYYGEMNKPYQPPDWDAVIREHGQ